MPETILYVCTTCRREADDPDGPRAGARLIDALKAQAGDSPGLRIEPVECLSVCKRPCTVAVASAGRWTYVYGDMDPAESAATRPAESPLPGHARADAFDRVEIPEVHDVGA